MTRLQSVPLSVLDLASVFEGESHAEALAHTVETARTAEALGYRRLWVAEHHGMPSIASSAPAVLISAMAAATSTIRLGSGGVMLPNHSSLIVAEQFGTLVGLYGDRIDLGLGRAPGTDQLTAAALRRGILNETAEDFPRQVLELLAYFGRIDPLEDGAGGAVVAVPGSESAPQIWLLGSSGFSARLAGMFGLPFAFAHHFAGGDNTALAFDLYRQRFEPSDLLAEPHSMVSVSTLVAETIEEAHRLMLPTSLHWVRMRSGGRPARIPTMAEAEAHDWTDAERAIASQRMQGQAIGDPDFVHERLEELVALTGADELLIAPQGPGHDTRIATLRLLSRVAVS